MTWEVIEPPPPSSPPSLLIYLKPVHIRHAGRGTTPEAYPEEGNINNVTISYFATDVAGFSDHGNLGGWEMELHQLILGAHPDFIQWFGMGGDYFGML